MFLPIELEETRLMFPAKIRQRVFLRMGIDGTALATEWSRYYAISGPDLG